MNIAGMGSPKYNLKNTFLIFKCFPTILVKIESNEAWVFVFKFLQKLTHNQLDKYERRYSHSKCNYKSQISIRVDCSSSQFKSAKLKGKEYTIKSINATSFWEHCKKERNWCIKFLMLVGRWSAVDIKVSDINTLVDS